MRRIDVEQNLDHRLRQRRVSADDVRAVAKTMMTRLMALTEAKRASIRTFRRSWHELYHLRLRDLRDWCDMAGDGLDRGFVAGVLETLAVFHDDPYIKTFDGSKMHVAIDNHAGNILLTPDGVEFLDIYQFKEHWLAVDPLVNITRPAADLAVLGNERLLHAYLTACASFVPLPDERIVLSYTVEAAMIMAAYRAMLKEPAIAARFVAYINANLPKLG